MEFAHVETPSQQVQIPKLLLTKIHLTDGYRVHEKSQLPKILTYVRGWQSRQPLILTRILLTIGTFYLNSLLNHLDLPNAKGKKRNKVEL